MGKDLSAGNPVTPREAARKEEQTEAVGNRGRKCEILNLGFAV
jgi:hypothetical protein